MSCKCATFDSEEGHWQCNASGSECVFIRPSSKACADIYGEGPDVPMTEEEKNNVVYSWFLYRDCHIYITKADFVIDDINTCDELFRSSEKLWHDLFGKIGKQNGIDITGDFYRSLIPSPEQKMLDEKIDQLLKG